MKYTYFAFSQKLRLFFLEPFYDFSKIAALRLYWINFTAKYLEIKWGSLKLSQIVSGFFC